MIPAMKSLPTLLLALLGVGCNNFRDNFRAQQKPTRPAPAPAPATARSRFVLYASSGETFLLDSDTGRVWRYDSKEKAFLETPVTSKIIKYDANGNRVEPNPKDPLGILDKPQTK